MKDKKDREKLKKEKRILAEKLHMEKSLKEAAP